VLALRSLLFALLLPGSVTLLIPYFVLTDAGVTSVPRWTVLQFAAVLVIAAGFAILVRCILDFARLGKGTLAPVDPPKALVVGGLYRYVRNPMYVGVTAVLVGEVALFESRALLWYTACWFLIVNLFVILYEEPVLRAKFGESYEQYRRSVGRWIPRRLK
jgi:protein-S-isoprenylcysteine O-methyltransferase Ste14